MSTSAATLFEGGIADLDAVMRVMDDSFDDRFGESWTASQCAGLLPMPGVWLTLARDGERDVIGFALARAIADEAELLLLAVKPAKQRGGVGRRLVERFLADAKRRGVSQVHLEVRDGNKAADFYRALGFSQVGRRRDYYSGADAVAYDALTMGRAIDLPK